MKTVSEVSRLSGVSVRTLRYYDQIGLLKPSQRAENGYRYYDSTSLAQLQEILLFRELDFPLKAIKKILASPLYDRREVLSKQIALLEYRKERLDKLVTHAESLLEEVNQMSFDVYDKTRLKMYQLEVEERWRETTAYEEFKQKSPININEALQGMSAIFREFGQIKDLAPSDNAVQQKVSDLQHYITPTFLYVY